MKTVAAVVVLCCAIVLGVSAPLRTEKLWFFGREYYRLDEWARANGFQCKLTGKKEVQVASQSTRIVFTGDSRKAVLNGVVVQLSNDVVVKNGVAYITPLDVSSTIAPVLWPPRSWTKPVKHICLDPGHGGRDVGEHSGREFEKKYTLLLAQELSEQLRKAGYTVSLTRAADVFVPLPDRAEMARRRGADLFISLHFNAFHGSDVSGAETYCVTPQGANSSNDHTGHGNTAAVGGNRNDARNMLLAYHIHRSVVRATGGEDRGVKRARYEVLRLANMPAVLLESGFMSNPAEAQRIYSAAWRRKIADAVVAGVRSYRNAIEP